MLKIITMNQEKFTMNYCFVWYWTWNSSGTAFSMRTMPSCVCEKTLSRYPHANTHRRTSFSMWPMFKAIHTEIVAKHPQNHTYRSVLFNYLLIYQFYLKCILFFVRLFFLFWFAINFLRTHFTNKLHRIGIYSKRQEL